MLHKHQHCSHCEERSDEAIHYRNWIASLAMTAEAYGLDIQLTIGIAGSTQPSPAMT